ncbi:MAG: endo-1,4-beta-xylanase, partial [Eubacterium sp.]
PEATYKITAYMKHASEDSTDVKCSIQMGDQYPEVANVADAPAGEWVKLEGEVEVPSSFSEYIIYFELPKDKKADFCIDSVEITQLTKGKELVDPNTLASIKDTYKDIFQYMGTCANYYGYGAKKDQLTTPKLVNFITRQFNSITLENEMKPESTLGMRKDLISLDEARALGYVIPDNYPETEVPRLSLDTLDLSLKFCADNGVKMRAHTLVWHQQTPTWFFAEDYSGNTTTTPEIMDARLEFFVRTMMNYVMDKEVELTGKAGSLVYAWDVTNEYVHRTKDPTSISWMDVYGDMKLQPSYVKKAFTFAYEELEKRNLQDDVVLFYNDYDEYDATDDIISLVNFINSDKKICGGIGMQSHLTGWESPTIDKYAETLDKFLATGLEIQVTELDAEVKGAENDEEGLAEQANYMKAIMETIVKKQLNRDKTVNPKGITGVTVWGLYDTCSWRSNIPLLFGSSINDPKPSFYAFIEAAKAK